MRRINIIESLEKRTLLAAAVGDIAGRMLAADLNGDGTDELVVVNGSNIEAWTMKNGVRDTVTTLYTQVGDERLVGAGDFDGDGTDDLVLKYTYHAGWSFYYHNQLKVLPVKDLQVGQSYGATTSEGAYFTGSADVDGDGRDEMITGGTARKVGPVGTVRATYPLGTVSNDPLQTHTGDMDGDGDGDVIFLNAATGDVGFWRIAMHSDGTAQVPYASEYVYMGVSDTANWQLLGFSSTASAGQLLWFHQSSGTVGAWTFANGVTSYHTVGTLEPGWRFVTTAELNGDSDQDVLFQSAATGKLIWWQMAGGAAGDATQLLGDSADQYNLPPDVVITGVHYPPGSYRVGESVDVTLDIKNQGASGKAYVNSFNPLVTVSTTNGIGLATGSYIPDWGYAGLNADSTFSIKVTFQWPAQLTGTQQLHFKLTATGPELYTNNTFVAPPDLFISNRPVYYAGDFDGDGDADLLVDNASQGRWEVWTVTDTARSEIHNIDLVPGSRAPRIGDFDGNGTDDILVQNDDGTYETWMMASGQIVQKNQLGYGAFLRGVGDINGDGIDDLVWSVGQGWTGAWIMQGGAAARWQTIGQASYKNWALLDIADIDGDGDDDFLWSSDKTRTLESWEFGTWIMDNGTPRWVSLGMIDGGLAIGNQDVDGNGGRYLGNGDFDGNGTADLLLAGHDQNGALVGRIWMTAPDLGHFVKVSGFPINFLDLGDVDGDGRDDIIYKQSWMHSITADLMDGPDPKPYGSRIIYSWGA